MKWFLVIVLSVYCAAQDDTLQIVSLPSAAAVLNDTRIIGGSTGDIRKYPYVVQVLYKRSLACGGSLITRRHVLTAAHCFIDSNGNVLSRRDYTVRAGTNRLQSGGTTRQVSAVTLHERYNNPARDNDVAVMRLASTYKLGTSINLARIPNQGAVVPDNSSVWHMGWGRTNPSLSTPSSVLLEVEVRTVNRAVCQAQYRLLETNTTRYPITDSMICSGLLGIGGKDACQGDSGGPLTYQGIVVGITSWGNGCADPMFPGVNARTSSYTNWISNVVNNNSANSSVVARLSALLIAACLLPSMLLRTS